MGKLSANELLDRMKNVYEKNKRDSSNLGTGADLFEPKFYVKAPEAIAKLMGVPGYPIGRISEIAGAYNSGKSSLGILAIIQAQQDGFYTLLIDTEGKFSRDRFEKMGGNYNDLNIIRAITLEEGFTGINNYLEILYGSDPDAKVFILWDSLGGTPSLAEVDAEADDTIQLATAAKVIKRNLRTLIPKWISKRDVGMLFINTTYDNIGSVGKSNSGGSGLNFAASIILQLTRTGNIIKQVKGEKVLCGIFSKAAIHKNHLMKSEYTLKELNFKVMAYEVDFSDKKQFKDELEGTNLSSKKE